MENKDLPSLGARQKLFTRLLGELIVWVYAQGWEMTLGEGYIGDSINKLSEDTPHLRTGTHFSRLGIDLNLFVDRVWMQGDCPEWQIIGAKWLGMDKLCRWGGSTLGDYNHLSLVLRIDPSGQEHY